MRLMEALALRAFDEYRVLRLIARGEKFEVYQAMAGTGQPVVLKIARKGSAATLVHLRREKEIAESLSLTALRPTWRVAQSSDGRVYAVAAWVERSLRELLAEGPLPRAQALAVLRGVAAGLDQLHARGFVHCALTPEHVLLSGDGEVFLCGLGYARRRGQKATVADERYASPELASGQPVGPWCDVYSLGLIAFEMLCGRLPFEAQSADEWRRAHAVLLPEVPRHLRQAIGRDAARALLRSLAKEPGDRFQSALTFVERMNESEPARARLQHAVLEVARGFFRGAARAPRAVKLFGFGLVLAGMLGGVFWLGTSQKPTPQPDPRTATAEFLAALSTPVTIWTPKPAETLSLAPTGQATPTPPKPASTPPLRQSPTAIALPPTPTPETRPLHPAPRLLEPADVTRFPPGAAVELVWQYDLPLEPGESFDIRMWKPGEPPWGIARSTETRYRLNGPPRGSGEYTWLVVVVRDDPVTGKVIETSLASEPRRIFWD
jgi:hypothetical protein